MRPISDDFGTRNGTTIANKQGILASVDEALGLSRPPDLELLLTDHLTCTDSNFSIAMHACLLRFGHVAVRYTTSDGVQRVMNILGSLETPGSQMVNFVPPEDYLYGTKGWTTYAQQGGAYNRDIVGVRVERVERGATDAMHAYFQALHRRSLVGSSDLVADGADDDAVLSARSAIRGKNTGAARFQLLEGRLSSLANQLPPLPGNLLRLGLERARSATEFLSKNQRADEQAPAATPALGFCREFAGRGQEHVRTATYTAGNCAQWTSSGLVFAGLLRRSRLFPKAILIQLLESEFAHKRAGNCHVVIYKHISHAPPYLPNYRFMRSAYVHPLNPVRCRRRYTHSTTCDLLR